MRGAVLVVLAVVGAVVVSASKPNIRPITIEELLNDHPDLKASLAAKLSASKAQQGSEPSAVSTTSTTTTTTTTTTTPPPQADSPTAPHSIHNPHRQKEDKGKGGEEGSRVPGDADRWQRHPHTLQQRRPPTDYVWCPANLCRMHEDSPRENEITKPPPPPHTGQR
ncbi:neurexin 1-like [Scylla paramamosain]|uniref:neurexin 1-like n=1 Tax=Scylla paramamosain TaxID=85552 RepID=UPI0030834862